MDYLNNTALYMKPKLPFLVLFFALFCTIEGLASIRGDGDTTKVGAILDLDSRMGKEQKIAMEIAVERFNNANRDISIQIIKYNQSPLQTAFAAEALIKENKVEVIIVGIDDWQATSLVAQVGTLAQVPILLLDASPPITSPFASLRWPFLLQLSHNATQQLQNIASIIHTYLWRKVIVVYEDDATNSGTITLLTQILQDIGSQIEYHLILPPFASTNHPRDAIHQKMKEVIDEKCHSRVFIVLKVSLPYVTLLFEEAKGMELMRNDSVWIMTKSITNFVPSFDTSIISSMEGAIGIMSNFDNSTMDFQIFEANFGIRYLEEYQNETYYEPSFEALLAYDAITTVIKAKHIIKDNKNFLNEILQSNFTGLSGKVIFNQEENSLAANASIMRLVNIASSNYHQVLDFSSDDIEDENTAKKLASEMNWPGKLKGATNPKGWAMPTYVKPMRIGVPIHTYNKNFINYTGTPVLEGDNYCLSTQISNINPNEKYSGYCIGLFKEVLNILDYQLPYEFIPYNGSYDDLIRLVHNKCFDAAIGDMTILEKRSELVEFTFPFEESGLSIVLPVVESYNSHGPWIFLKPFTTTMWLVTWSVFIYTMFIIWALEHGSNSDFRGSWSNQLSATLWFSFNSLYFAQREKISSIARVVVIIWLFIVMILSTSYTANLTSMITNERLNQTTIDIEMLERNNAKVGYDVLSFVDKFLEDLLKFDSKNIIPIDGKFEDIHKELQTGNISAACLEFPYAQLFVTQYCNKYMMTKPIHRFGGFGFVFPKGSPIAVDVSEAILKLTEKGDLKKLEKTYLKIRPECSRTSDDTNNKNDGYQGILSFQSFQFLFYTSVSATTLCLLASFIPLCTNYFRRTTTTHQPPTA